MYNEYWHICVYLIPRAKYAHVCFGSPILGLVQNSMKIVVYLTFVVPLDIFPSIDNHYDIHMHQTEIKYSSKKEVATTHDSPLVKKISKSNILPFFQRLINIITFAHTLFTFLLYVIRFPSVRFCINFISILFRMDLLIFLSFIGLLSVVLSKGLIIMPAFIIVRKISSSPFLLWQRLHCFLLFSRSLRYIVVVYWKWNEIESLFWEKIFTFYLNYFMINICIITFIKKKTVAHNHYFCSVLVFYGALYFLFSVVIVQIFLWLYMFV